MSAQDKIPFKKIYIDSKYATSDSISTSRFKVQLPQTCQLPDNCVFYLCDVCIPHSWKTIEEGYNDTLYVMMVNPDSTTPGDTFRGHIVQLASNNYTPTTFAAELQTRLRALSATFQVTIDSASANSGIIIQNTAASVQWKLLTDDDLINERYVIQNFNYNKGNLRSVNDMIRNIKSNDVIIGGVGSSVQSYSSEFLNLNWINNIYISSPNLGSFDTIFAGNGATNVIKKVPVTVNYGFMVIDQLMNPNEYLDCSRQTLQSLEFHLKTSRGQFVPLHGAHVSFSILFNKI